VLDILLEILEFLGFISLRKKKKKHTESTAPESKDPAQEGDRSPGVPQGGVSVCAGCSRRLEEDAVYELGKTWCMECYKSHVLKIQG